MNEGENISETAEPSVSKTAREILDEVDVAIRYVLLAEPADHARGIVRDATVCPWSGRPISENPHGCAWCAARSILRKVAPFAALTQPTLSAPPSSPAASSGVSDG